MDIEIFDLKCFSVNLSGFVYNSITEFTHFGFFKYAYLYSAWILNLRYKLFILKISNIL